MNKWCLCIFFVLNVLTGMATEVELFSVGKGEYTWFGIKIYDAEFFATNHFKGDFQSSQPLALEILYDINIDDSDLVATTQDEWDDLKIGRSEICARQSEWSKRLIEIWPDLKQGDRLKILVNESRQSQFFHNSEPIGGIDDPNFATCFLAIWLAEDTSADDLRVDLLAL